MALTRVREKRRRERSSEVELPRVEMGMACVWRGPQRLAALALQRAH